MNDFRNRNMVQLKLYDHKKTYYSFRSFFQVRLSGEVEGCRGGKPARQKTAEIDAAAAALEQAQALHSSRSEEFDRVR